jgi:dTDP-4-amino-4,6-dideoxygalactose transaminase
MRELFVAKPFLPKRSEIDYWLDQIWENAWLTNAGPLHNELERRLCSFLGVSHLELTANGHLALELALREGSHVSGEVITTPFTFASTIHAIVRSGAQPVFADIKPEDATLDPRSIERCISDNTTAILPVHVYGHPCDTKAIESIARKHNLKVIYDASHAFDVKVDGTSLLLRGDFSTLSFHATKLFTTAEGGAVVYSDEAVGQRLKSGKNFGIINEEIVESSGGNGKMSELHAAMGLASLPYVKEIIESRQRVTERYRTHLAGHPSITLFYPDKNPAVSYNYAYFPTLIAPDASHSRDAIYTKLKERGVFSRRYFWPLATEYLCYRDQKRDDLPVAESISSQILCLPMYHGLSFDEVDYICESMLSLLSS